MRVTKAPTTSRDVVLAAYKRDCKYYDRSQWIALAIMFVFVISMLPIHVPSNSRVWSFYFGAWYITMVAVCAVQLRYYLPARRYRLTLARLDGKNPSWVTAFTFAPDEGRSVWADPLQYAQDLCWRQFPMSLLIVIPFTISIIQNIGQGRPLL